MAAGDDPSAKDIAGWFTPEQVMEIARESKGDFAAKILMDRLIGGFLVAVASGNSKTVGNGRPFVIRKPQHIRPEFWPHRQADDFWQTGDVHFSIPNQRGIGPSTHWRCTQIRFRPEDIMEMFPAQDPTIVAVVGKFGGASVKQGAPSRPTGLTAITSPATSPAAPVASVPVTAEEPQQKGPPLAAKALTAWYEAYKLAYRENERTLDHAWSRAKSAFPDKTVTRRSVRALMAGGKPGPRAKT